MKCFLQSQTLFYILIIISLNMICYYFYIGNVTINDLYIPNINIIIYMILKFFFKKNAIPSVYIGIKIWMYDSTFYSKKYKCPLMFLFYLEIIDPTFIYFLWKKWMLHSSLAYMQLNQISPNVLTTNHVKGRFIRA